MNRLLAACVVTVFGALSFGCAVTGVGDPCIPEDEFAPNSGQSVIDELVIDVNSVQCETRVCLRHYFRGRVSCPFGNGALPGQGLGATCGPSGDCPAGSLCSGKTADSPGTCFAPCKQVPGRRNLFTLEGSFPGTLCCPVLGDLNQKPVQKIVEGQCTNRQAKDSVYCSCRCDVPEDPEIDRSQVSLCECPTGFSCKPLCDKVNGNCGPLPKGKWGSYCVKDGPTGANFNPAQAEATCGAELKP